MAAKFEADRRVTTLLPRRLGRPAWISLIDPKVDEVIDRQVRGYYLRPELGIRYDDVGVLGVVIVPHLLEQHCTRHHLAGVSHQILKQTKLARQ